MVQLHINAGNSNWSSMECDGFGIVFDRLVADVPYCGVLFNFSTNYLYDNFHQEKILFSCRSFSISLIGLNSRIVTDLEYKEAS